MLTTKQLEVAETVFDRNRRREAEISDALRQEQARHNAAVKNMQRLRALRLGSKLINFSVSRIDPDSFWEGDRDHAQEFVLAEQRAVGSN